MAQMGNLDAHTGFRVVKALAVDVSLNSTYMYKCSQGIVLSERKIVPVYPVAFVIPGIGIEAELATISSHEALIDEENEHATILV